MAVETLWDSERELAVFMCNTTGVTVHRPVVCEFRTMGHAFERWASDAHGVSDVRDLSDEQFVDSMVGWGEMTFDQRVELAEKHYQPVS